MFPKRGRNKFGAKKTELAGQWFDSKAESEMYLILCRWLDDGEIISIERQQTIRLTDAQIGYRVDFVITKPDGTIEGVEFKGHSDAIWLLKKKLYKFYGPFKLSIYKKSGKSIYLDEVINPLCRNEQK